MIEVTATPTALYDGTVMAWHDIETDHGRARALLRPAGSVLVDFSPCELDERGSTLYRNADPDADEIQSGMAVLVRPFRANGVPVDGMAEVETDGKATERGLYRAGTPFSPLSDAGRRRALLYAREIAAAVRVLPESVTLARTGGAFEELARAQGSALAAQEALQAAQAGLQAAQEALAAAHARTAGVSPYGPTDRCMACGSHIADPHGPACPLSDEEA